MASLSRVIFSFARVGLRRPLLSSVSAIQTRGAAKIKKPVYGVAWGMPAQGAQQPDISSKVGLLKNFDAKTLDMKALEAKVEKAQFPMMIPDHTFRGKSAKALFLIGTEANLLAQIRDEFHAILALLHSSFETVTVLNFKLPALRTALITNILNKNNVSPLFKRVIPLIFEKHEATLTDLDLVYDHFNALRAAHLKEVKGSIVSADPLSQAEMSSLVKVIESTILTSGQKLLLETSVDPSLLAGFRLRVGNKGADLSFAQQLRRQGVKEIKDLKAFAGQQ
eukprot:TRINITY_DN1405_c0_g1_i1.p1 TRINITY_DN1405_c0_g1~~TRINITY_DN1405_c0_g1_i1.p1  ORF type:complete len:280 (+),score=131.92 TRINITY_DN1405_c0_g1_i1:66-905(+)